MTLCITCQRAAYLCSCASCELLGWILKMASCVTVPVRTTGPNRRARVRGAYTEKIPARRGLGWCEPGPRPVCSGIGAERVQSFAANSGGGGGGCTPRRLSLACATATCVLLVVWAWARIGGVVVRPAGLNITYFWTARTSLLLETQRRTPL